MKRTYDEKSCMVQTCTPKHIFDRYNVENIGIGSVVNIKKMLFNYIT